MKRLFAGAALVALLSVLAPAGAVSAHVLKVDGDIGAVLHINPDDAPTTGTPTDYIMSFDDNTGRFSLPACDCTVSIIANGKALAHKPLAVSSNLVSENHYAFVKPGVYTMRFTGTPNRSGAFQPFTLNYEVRVAGGRTAVQPFPALLWIGTAGAMALVLLAAYARDYT